VSLPDDCASLAHLPDCALGIARMDIHAPDSLLVDTYAKSGSQRVKRRVLHAIVGGEAADRYLVDPAVSQPTLESGAFKSRVSPGRDDEIEIARRRELVDPLGDLISIRYRQRSAGREVVLEVDDDQG
jgi:hypothetical protein